MAGLMNDREESKVLRTVGVDVAKDPATTAVSTIRWTHSVAVVEALLIPATDDVVYAAATAPGVAAVALDAPFGWPTAMIEAVSSWRPGGRWTAPKDDAFRLRRTDVFTAKRTKEAVKARRAAGATGQQGAVPLSVSADKIAMAAWRGCALLNALALRGVEVVTDTVGRTLPIDGRGRVVEAYPAAALAMWGIPRHGYKNLDEAGIRVRLEILDAVERAGGDGWVDWSPGAREACAATDHALDALICALVARAAVLGLVETVPLDDVAASRAEGWIAVPRADSLSALSLWNTHRAVDVAPNEG